MKKLEKLILTNIDWYGIIHISVGGSKGITMQVNELYGNEPITVESYLEKCGVEDTKEYLNPTGKRWYLWTKLKRYIK